MATEYQVLVEGLRGNASAGAMALDDLAIETGECRAPLSCTFEYGLCGWTHEKNSQFYWQLETGISSDHTFNSYDGM